jgi:hypothetical protein
MANKKYTKKQLQRLTNEELLKIERELAGELVESSKRVMSPVSTKNIKRKYVDINGGTFPILTTTEIRIINMGDLPEDTDDILFRVGGHMECMGEAGGPPCYWVPDTHEPGIDIEPPDDDEEEETEEDSFLGCGLFQEGYTPNDNCPDGFVCLGNSAGDLCCPPRVTSEYIGSGPSGYTWSCSSDTPPQFCGDPHARNYNPFAHFSGNIPTEYGGGVPPYSHNAGDCIYCDPANELGNGSVWTDCVEYCTDESRWYYDGGIWQKGDLNRDGNINVSDIIGQLSVILESGGLTSGEKACAMWASDINDDRNIDVLDVITNVDTILSDYTTVDADLKVMHFNVGHLYYFPLKNLVDYSGEGPPYCKEGCDTQGLCRQDDQFRIKQIIQNESPDIVTLTELVSPNTCENKPECQSQQEIPMSVCYDWRHEMWDDPTLNTACQYSCDVWSTYLGSGDAFRQEDGNDWEILIYDTESANPACSGHTLECDIYNWNPFNLLGNCICECENGQVITDNSGYDCATAHSSDLIGQFYYYLNCIDNNICEEACAEAFPNECTSNLYCIGEEPLESLLNVDIYYYWDIWPEGYFYDGHGGGVLDTDQFEFGTGDLPYHWDCPQTIPEQQTYDCYCEEYSFRAQQIMRNGIYDDNITGLQKYNGHSSVRQLLGPDYTIVCNHGTGEDGYHPKWYYDGVSCIGVKTSVGEVENCGLGELCMSDYDFDTCDEFHLRECYDLLISHPAAHTLEYPEECGTLAGWQNTTWINVMNVLGTSADLKVIHTHPLTSGKDYTSLKIDECRTGFLRQIFGGDGVGHNQMENVLVAGDFNMDPYRIKYGNLIDWGNAPGDGQSGEAVAYNTGLLRNWINNWSWNENGGRNWGEYEVPMIWNTGEIEQPIYNDDETEIIGYNPLGLGIKMWDLQINVDDVYFDLFKLSGCDYDEDNKVIEDSCTVTEVNYGVNNGCTLWSDENCDWLQPGCVCLQGEPADSYIFSLNFSLPRTSEEGFGNDPNGFGMNFKTCGVPYNAGISTALTALGLHCNINSAFPETNGQDPWYGLEGDIRVNWRLSPNGNGGNKREWLGTLADMEFEVLDGPGEWFGLDFYEWVLDAAIAIKATDTIANCNDFLSGPPHPQEGIGGAVHGLLATMACASNTFFRPDVTSEMFSHLPSGGFDGYISNIFNDTALNPLIEQIAINYQDMENYSQSNVAGYNLEDSTSYWHDNIQNTGRWTVHNVPAAWSYDNSSLLSENIPLAGDLDDNPEKTFGMFFVENTLDYVVSNFSNSRDCHVHRPKTTNYNGYAEYFTDHSYIACNLNSQLKIPNN